MAKVTYTDELEFEHDLVNLLITRKGWTGLGGQSRVLSHPTEQDLLDNWARILFENNNMPNRLNGVPLTDGEKAQLMEQVRACSSPVEANEFINGRSVTIKRDAEADKLNFGREVALTIYDRMSIAGGKSVYQIAEQPEFRARKEILPNRRGDLILLINGMPVIHIELKRSGVSVTQAVNQIRKYYHEGVFEGLLSLVQVFVAMNPTEALYFANPGSDESFNEKFMFHWGTVDNERVDRWDAVAEQLLSIPMAHKLVGFYTVADHSDNVLKVMRSYQYHAADRIRLACENVVWGAGRPVGGYVWHTTGSGKTLTSFKAAQLIAAGGNVDKVVFLVDRIELGTQSLDEYRGFADARERVHSTEDTDVLQGLLASGGHAGESTMLIVTSIQKMNVLVSDAARAHDVEKIAEKRIVIIVDECHRSVFGDMMWGIRRKLPQALLFGFTGTPIVEANAKRGEVTTVDVFGNELCHYTIANGIYDGSVLGFDLTYSSVYDEDELREQVALEKAKATSVAEAFEDEDKKNTYLHYMNEVPMVDRYWDEDSGQYKKGIEGLVPRSQYETDGYRREIVSDIKKNWKRLSIGGKFHALLAASSIVEAIEYYRLCKEMLPELAVTALFDPDPGNNAGNIFKEDGLVEILGDYNERYGKSYSLSDYTDSNPLKDTFKRDVSARLAHKKPYSRIDLHPEMRLDMLIVVDQMLTGYDSKWLNTIYMDKVMDYEHVIQAFCRPNRTLSTDKPFGSIRCYREPNTMKKNVEDALALYSGGAANRMFVLKLKDNIEGMNGVFEEIRRIFSSSGIEGFERIPDTQAGRAQFALKWRSLNDLLCAAKVQGFSFERLAYGFVERDGELVLVDEGAEADEEIRVALDEVTYLVLAQRYKELFASGGSGGSGDGDDEVPYDIDPNLMRIDTERIDASYLEEKFADWLHIHESADQDPNSDEHDRENAALDELHSQFSKLSAEDQVFAEQIIQGIRDGKIEIDDGWNFRDYINHAKQSHDQGLVSDVARLTGVDKEALLELMSTHPTEATLDLHNRFTSLVEKVDYAAARNRIEALAERKVKGRDVSRIIDGLLRRFIVEGPFDVVEGIKELL